MILKIILAIIAFFTLREVYTYLLLQKYRKNPKAYVMYYPALYQIYRLMTSFMKGDIFKASKQNYIDNDLSKYDFVISNNFSRANVMVSCNSQRAIREYYSKEVEHVIKESSINKGFLGFFFVNGKEGVKMRTKFIKIFIIENIKKLVPGIKLAVKTHIKLWENELKKTESGKMKLKIKDIFGPMLTDISCMINFGMDNKSCEKTEGRTMLENSEEMAKSGLKAGFSILRFTTFGLAEKFKLLPGMKDMKKFQNLIQKGITSTYLKREKEILTNKKANEVPNLLDIIIEFNNSRKTEEEKMTMKEISDNFSLFLFAAKDTTTQACTNLVSQMVMNPHILENLKKKSMKIQR